MPTAPLVLYNPYKPQLAFHNSTCTFRLYGGAAGGGKSHGIRFEAIRQCLSMPGVKGLILRRTFSELEGSIINPMLDSLPKGSYKYNASKHILTFSNGSTIEFGHCQYDKDVRKYQGQEYDFIAIDELTHFTEYMFTYLTGSRLRTTKPNMTANFFGTTNPGGIGHAWVRRIWIDRQFIGAEKPENYSFHPAKVTDNLALMENDPGYIARLESLPEMQRRALLDGDWDVFDGQYFTEFRRDIHVTEKPIMPIRQVKRIIAIDYGYAAPSCALWMTIDSQGHVWVYRELYQENLLYKDLACKIKELTTKEEIIDRIVVDPATVNKTTEATGTTAKKVFATHGLPIIGANNARVEGWNVMRKYLQPLIDPNSGEVNPKIHISPMCANLIRTLPEMQHDTKNVEDINTKLEDHAADALRYGLMDLDNQGADAKHMSNLNDMFTKTSPDEDDVYNNVQNSFDKTTF